MQYKGLLWYEATWKNELGKYQTELVAFRVQGTERIPIVDKRSANFIQSLRKAATEKREVRFQEPWTPQVLALFQEYVH